MKRKLVLIFLLLISTYSSSQTLDQFKKKADHSQNIEEKVDALIEIVDYFSKKNIDSALFYSEKAITLSKKHKKDTLLTKALMRKGLYAAYKGDLEKSQAILNNNLTRPIDSISLALNYMYIGTSNKIQKKFDKAIENYLKAIYIYEKLDRKEKLAMVYTNIAITNAQTRNYKNAELYFNKALLNVQNNIGLEMSLNMNLSSLNLDTKNYNKSLNYSKKAELLAKKIGSKKHLSVIYTNLSNLFGRDDYKGKDLNKAIEYGKRSLKLKKEFGNKAKLPYSYATLANAYYENKNYDKAIFYLEEGLVHAKGAIKKSILILLQKAYTINNNTKKALYFTDEYVNLTDSLAKRKQEEKVAEIIVKHESAKKQQQINLLNIKNSLQKSRIKNKDNLLIGGGLTILFLSLVLYLWYLNQKTKQELQQASLKHKLLQIQLNPHFLFHSLNSIQSYIYQNKKEESIEYLSSYIKLMRSIFESASEDFISIQQDVQTIREYLNLQKLNFEKSVDFSVKSDDQISQYQIPPMLVQPYVENAIQHGIKNIKHGEIKINYSDKNEQISVTIFDNGMGYYNNTSNNKLHKISSSEVIEQRIQNIEKTHQFNINRIVTTNKNGTQVTLTFPKKIHDL